MSVSSYVTDPSSGSKIPTNVRNKVVFPAPFLPSNPMILPLCNVKETSSKIV